MLPSRVHPIDISTRLAIAAYAARRPSHSQRSIARAAGLSNSTVGRVERWLAAGGAEWHEFRPETLYAYAHAIAYLECEADALRAELERIAKGWTR